MTEAVLRTVEVNSPDYLYTAAQQTADFGAVQWNVLVRVAQVSATFGAGIAAQTLTYDT